MIKIFDSYTPRYYLRYLFFRCIPVFLYKLVLIYKYKKSKLGNLNFNFPEKLSEKIQWIKLYGITEQKKNLTDKIEVKKYINKIVPELKYAKIYQVSDSFRNLNFDKLPARFILKTNHAWDTNIVIDDKNLLQASDYKKLEKFYNKVLNINYAYWSYYELQYQDIEPKIFAEELLADGDKIKDYEVFCFNGKPEIILYRYPIRIDEYYRLDQCFFNIKWEKQSFFINWENGVEDFLCSNKDKVIEYASKLCKDIDFVRVDFMEINNEIYFCEMTFTPYSGFCSFSDEKYDLLYGLKLKI